MKHKTRSAASSLVFQVEAIPQTIGTLHATKETPVEVKLKVRKRRNKKDMILTVPNYLIPNADPSKIQPLESNQTLVTFNMLMEKSSPVTNGKNNGTLKRLMGATKGGGCLDPPYDEDMHSYQPKRNTKDLRKDSESRKIDNRNSKLSETSTKKFTVFSRKQKSSEIVKIDSKINKTLNAVRDTNTSKLSTHLIYSNKKPESENQSINEQTPNTENEKNLDKHEKILNNFATQKVIHHDVNSHNVVSRTSPIVSNREKELFHDKMHNHNENTNSFLLGSQPNRTNCSNQYSVSDVGLKESELVPKNTEKTNDNYNKIIRNASITKQKSSSSMKNIYDDHYTSKIESAVFKGIHESSNDDTNRVTAKFINKKPELVADLEISKEIAYTDVNIKAQGESDFANYKNNIDPILAYDSQTKEIVDHKMNNVSSSHANIFMGTNMRNAEDLAVIDSKEQPQNFNQKKHNPNMYSDHDFAKSKNDHQNMFSKTDINVNAKEHETSSKEADYIISEKDDFPNLNKNDELVQKYLGNKKEEEYSVYSRSSRKDFPEIQPISNLKPKEIENEYSSKQHTPGMRVSYSELKKNQNEPIINTKLEDRFADSNSNIDNGTYTPSFIKPDLDDTLTKIEIGDQKSPVTIMANQEQNTYLTNPKKTGIAGAKTEKDQRDNLTQGDEIKIIFSERTLVESVLEEHLSDENLDDTHQSIKNDLTEDIKIQDISRISNNIIDSKSLIVPYSIQSNDTPIDKLAQHQMKESSMIGIDPNDSKNILDILERTTMKSLSDEYVSARKSQSLLTDTNVMENRENDEIKKIEYEKSYLDKDESPKYQPLSNNVLQTAAEEHYDNYDNTGDQIISLVSDKISPANVNPKPSQQFTTALPENPHGEVTADYIKLNPQLNTRLVNEQNEKFTVESDLKTKEVFAGLLVTTDTNSTANFEAIREIDINNDEGSSSKKQDQHLKNGEYVFDESKKEESDTGIIMDAKLTADLRNFGNDAKDTTEENDNNFLSQENDTTGQSFDIIKYSSIIPDIEQSILPFSEQDFTNVTVGDDSLDIPNEQTEGQIKKESKNIVDMVCYLAESMIETINDTKIDDPQKHADKFKENNILVESNKDLHMDHGDVYQNIKNYPDTSSKESIRGDSKGPKAFDQNEQIALFTQGVTGKMIEKPGNDMKAVAIEQDYPVTEDEASSIVSNDRQTDLTKSFPFRENKIEAKDQSKISGSKCKCSKGKTTEVSNNKNKHIQTKFNNEYDTAVDVEIMKIISIYEDIALMKTAITELTFQIKMLEDRLLLLRQSIIGWKSKSKLARVPNTRCIRVRQRSSKNSLKKSKCTT